MTTTAIGGKFGTSRCIEVARQYIFAARLAERARDSARELSSE